MYNIFNYIKTHWYIILGFFVTFYFIKNFSAISQTLISICAIEFLALILSSLCIYVYSNLEVIQKEIEGDDLELSKIEQLGKSLIIGMIFLGVHILVGIVTFGIYFVQYSNFN